MKKTKKLSKKKFNEYVMSMSEEMGCPTLEQFAYMENTIPAIAYVNKKGRIKCMDCGHEWISDKCSIDGTIECPHCHRKLKIEWTEKTSILHRAFINLSQAWGEHWQVVRYFYATHLCCSTQKIPNKDINEVMQIWISDKGDVVYISKKLSMYPNRQINPFIMYSDMSVRNMIESNNYGYYHFDIRQIRDDTFKIFSVSKFLQYRGVKKNVNRVNGGFFLDSLFQILQEPLAEVIFKKKQWSLLRVLYKTGYYRRDEHYSERIAALKIALRHHYFENSRLVEAHHQYKYDSRPLYSDWVDNINLAIKLGLDYRSPKYCCPDNIQKIHSELISKAEKDRAKKDERDKLVAEEEKNEKYQKMRSKFFSINWVDEDNDFSVQVLKSVDDFFKEGKEMHHCVFDCGYYNMALHPDSLILSVRKGTDWSKSNEILETVEVNLKEYVISQARGLQNKVTEYHGRIIRFINKHMDEIIEINESKKSKVA